MSLQSVSWEHEDEDLQSLKEWFYPEHFSLAQDLRHKATSKVSIGPIFDFIPYTNKLGLGI